MQAQDYGAALWAIGLRSGSAEAEVEAAIDRRQIVRTWPMRGTLHFVPAADAGWMVEYLAPRVVASARGRARQLGLDVETFAAARRVFVATLRDGGQLTRAEAYAALAHAGIDPAGQRGIHILSRLAMERVLCLGPRRGKQPTFVLMDEWVPKPNRPGRDEALRLLAERYFHTHGPASVEDFSWWSGMLLSEARRVCDELPLETAGAWNGRTLLAFAATELPKHTNTRVRLLAAFDEYVLGYRDRSVCLSAAVDHYVTKNGVFLATIVLDGEVVGIWRRRRTRTGVTLTCEAFRRLDEDVMTAVDAEARRFSAFVEAPVVVEWTPG